MLKGGRIVYPSEYYKASGGGCGCDKKKRRLSNRKNKSKKNLSKRKQSNSKRKQRNSRKRSSRKRRN